MDFFAAKSPKQSPLSTIKTKRLLTPSLKKLYAGFLLVICLVNSAAHAQTKDDLNTIVEHHRKIILLLSKSDARDDVVAHDTFIARNYYYLKRELLEAYELAIVGSDDDSKPSFKVLRTKTINTLVHYIEQDEIHAGDQLAFTDLVDAILYEHQVAPFLSIEHLMKLKRIEQDLEKIQDAYGSKLKDLYGLLGTRGKTIEKWDDYLSYLQSHYPRKQIRNQFNNQQTQLSAPATRGKGAKSKKKDPNLVWGFGIPEKTVVLTFDDGPHYRHTDTILDTLKEYDAHAYFFAVGKNFGIENKNKKLSLKNNATKLKRAIKEGHRLGNHSFTHRILTKLEANEQKKEMSDTNTLLKLISGKDNTVFRPPYGSKNDGLQKITTDLGMRSIMWNIDSMDWGDPLAESIVERVMSHLSKNKRGIILFHDIHKQTVKALPSLLKKLKEEGYKIVDIDGNAFNTPKKVLTPKTPKTPKTPEVVKSSYYRESWAVIVGINAYEEWPKLSYAVNDAKAIEEKLINQFGFKKDHVFSLYDEDATRDNITDLLANKMADPRMVSPDDRVFIFYAGHGMTRKLPSGRDLGYLIPVDAAYDKFHSRSISMTHLRDFSEMIPAKHVYYIMDSCYSGIALTRGGAGSAAHSSYLDEITSRHARQILTAGGANQEVADGGLNGHSIFTWTLLQGMEGNADLDNNDIITASELGAYVAPIVANNSNQTPAFGNLLGSAGGEFIFELKPKIKPATEKTDAKPSGKHAKALQALQQELAKIREHNNILQLELASLRSQTANTAVRSRTGNMNSSQYNHLPPKERKSLSLKHHKTGLALYKKKQFKQSLEKLKLAVELNPTNSSIVNNYGFVLYKAEKFEESLIWLEKTIELEPKRTVVYLNIADTLVKLERDKEAVAYYEHYLFLYPSSPEAEKIKGKIEKIKNLAE